MAEPQIDVMDEGGAQSMGAKYAVNPSTGQVMRNDGSGWSKVTSAKNAQGEILINEGGSWIPVPKGGQARAPMTRKDVVPLMAREGLEWGTSDESEGARRAAGLPKWADKAINATPMGTFANIGMGVGAIGAESAGANMPDAYTQGRDEVRGNINQARDEYPVTSMVSEIAGGAAYPGGAMKGGAPLVKQVPRMGALGAVQGGAYGFNSAEGDLGDRADAGKTGAAFGAALGAALPVGVAGARVPVRTLKNTGASLYDGFMGLFGKDGGARMGAAEKTAIAAVRRSMERSQMTPQQIAEAVREFGDKPAVLAEVIGQDAVDALTALTRKPGSTSQKAQAIIEDRYEGFADRAQDDLERATGVGRGQAPEQFSKLVEDQQKVARPLYNQLSRDFADISSERLDELSRVSAIKPLVSAKKPKDLPQGGPADLPSDMSPELEAWAQSLLAPPPESGLRPLSGAAVQEARDLAIAQGRDPKSVSRMDVYDLVKRKLDDKVRAAQKNENHTDLNRYSQIRDALVDELDALTGGQYKAAREAGMGPKLRAAQSQGDRILNSNIRGADVAQTSTSSPQEARALQLGAVDLLSTKIDNNTTPNRLARVPANAEKITTALGDDAGGQFVSKMEAEAKLRDTGSRWGPRMSSVTGTVAERPKDSLLDDGARIGMNLATGRVREAIIAAASIMRRRGYNQREIDAMGDLLLSNPQEGLRRLGVQLPNSGNGGAGANALGGSGGGSVSQAPAQQGVNALAPVKAGGFGGAHSDAGSAVLGGMVSGSAPADSTQERLENIALGAVGGYAAGRGGRSLMARVPQSYAKNLEQAADVESIVNVLGTTHGKPKTSFTRAATAEEVEDASLQAIDDIADALRSKGLAPDGATGRHQAQMHVMDGTRGPDDVPMRAFRQVARDRLAARGLEAPEELLRGESAMTNRGEEMLRGRLTDALDEVRGNKPVTSAAEELPRRGDQTQQGVSSRFNLEGWEPPTSSSGIAVNGDAGNALVGGAVGGAMPADSQEERLRNMAIGAVGVPLAGRIGPSRAGTASAGVPPIKPDVPLGKGPKNGNRLGRGLEDLVREQNAPRIPKPPPMEPRRPSNALAAQEAPQAAPVPRKSMETPAHGDMGGLGLLGIPGGLAAIFYGGPMLADAMGERERKQQFQKANSAREAQLQGVSLPQGLASQRKALVQTVLSSKGQERRTAVEKLDALDQDIDRVLGGFPPVPSIKPSQDSNALAGQ